MNEKASIHLFAGLEGREIGVILAAATKRRLHKLDIITRSDQAATQLYLVHAGCINLYVLTRDGQRVLLRRLESRDAFGLGAFLTEPAGYIGTAQAVRDSELLLWDHRLVRHLARTYPRFLENALQVVVSCLGLCIKRHVGLLSDSAQQRLASALTHLAAHSGRILPRGIEIEINNEDLASLADVSFFTASRLLKSWERKGAVEKSRGKILICHPEKMLAA